jgi:hypothetical protein
MAAFQVVQKLRKRETETERAVSISEGEEMSREIVVGGRTADGEENWEVLVLEGKEEGVRREIVVYRRIADGEENCEFLAPDVHQTGEKRRICKKLHRLKRFLERERERERVVSRAIVVVSEETLLLERTKWSIRGQNVDGQKKRVIFAWRELTECCTGMQYEFSRYPFYFIGGVGCWPWGTMARREEKRRVSLEGMKVRMKVGNQGMEFT